MGTFLEVWLCCRKRVSVWQEQRVRIDWCVEGEVRFYTASFLGLPDDHRFILSQGTSDPGGSVQKGT